jgi:hypothetical protein
MPPIDRVLGALPTIHYNDLPIPGLAGDLERVAVANRLGVLNRTHPLLTFLIAVGAVLLLLIVAGWLMLRRHRRKTAPTVT